MSMTMTSTFFSGLPQDLNPIEHLWDVVAQQIHGMKGHLKNVQELHDAIMPR